MTRKKKRAPEQAVESEAQREERLHRLRELEARGWAELGAEPPASPEERLRRLRELEARGWAEVEERRRAAGSGS